MIQDEVNGHGDPEKVKMESELVEDGEKKSSSLGEMTKAFPGPSLGHAGLIISHHDTDSNLKKLGKEEEAVVSSRCRETGSVGLFLQEAGHSHLPFNDVVRHGSGMIVSKSGEADLLEH